MHTELSVEELAVLSSFDRPMEPLEASQRAAGTFSTPRFDRDVALVTIHRLLACGMLQRAEGDVSKLVMSQRGFNATSKALVALKVLGDEVDRTLFITGTARNFKW